MLKIRALILIMFLIVSSVCLVRVGLVEANFMPLNIPQHSIEITSDGNITGTDRIICRDAEYEFTGNISGNIVIFCDNITINGNGYWLEGNGESFGIFMEGIMGVTVKNLTITNFATGVGFSYAPRNCGDDSLVSNTILNCTLGIFCYEVKGAITISRNQISNCSTGIAAFEANNIYIYGNTIAYNNAAVSFAYGVDCFVYGNNFINNSAHIKSATVTWDNRRMGNFWSNYTGPDLNRDGIIDKFYMIDENNIDHYPRMSLIPETSLILSPRDDEPQMPWTTVLAAVVSTGIAAILVATLLLYRRNKNLKPYVEDPKNSDDAKKLPFEV